MDQPSKKAEKKQEASWLDKKIEAIKKSAMPEEQKQALLVEIGAVKDVPQEGIPFHVYAKIKGIPEEKHKAHLAFPKAKDVRLASPVQWDEIFKGF
jgi:hypothetical protein